ncbi:MAG: molybdopterin-binding protein [Candidatus Bathyarchaeia archaeon]
MFRKLLTLKEAQTVLYQNFSPKSVGIERVLLLNAYGRICAEDVKASVDVPPFHRSTVDGYVVRAEDTFGAEEDKPITLKVIGKAQVGQLTAIKIAPNTTVEIATGAPLPKGGDAVVMFENTIRKNSTLKVYRAVAKGENVMKAGSDIRHGDVLLKKNQTITPPLIGALAATGATEITVFKRPKVAVISTGGEVQEPGKPLPPGRIYDINAYTLTAAVSECGCEPVYFGIVPDDFEDLKKTLRKALASADVVVTSGGVSVGPKDLMPKVLNGLGKPGVIICGIAVKPGKPTTIAVVEGKPVFALPGHPTSALLIFHILAKPVLFAMAGWIKEPEHMRVEAVAGERIFSARGRRTFVTVNLVQDKSGETRAFPVATGQSGAITTLAKAEGFIEIDEQTQFVDEGEKVTVHLF